MAELTLLRRQSSLAMPEEQLRILDSVTDVPSFEEKLRIHECISLDADGIEVLQVNVGKQCNQTCRHCHVDAGPERRESMSQQVVVVRVGRRPALSDDPVDDASHRRDGLPVPPRRRERSAHQPRVGDQDRVAVPI